MLKTPMPGHAMLAALVVAWTPVALAAPPDPFRIVPADRAGQASAGADRVFGGAPVPDGRYPFQVALLKPRRCRPIRPASMKRSSAAAP